MVFDAYLQTFHIQSLWGHSGVVMLHAQLAEITVHSTLKSPLAFLTLCRFSPRTFSYSSLLLLVVILSSLLV